MTNKLYCYIRDTFSVSIDCLNVLDCIFRMMQEDCHTLTTCDFDPSYLVPDFWHRFLYVCEAGNIDLTEEELFKNTEDAVKRDEYYS